LGVYPTQRKARFNDIETWMTLRRFCVRQV